MNGAPIDVWYALLHLSARSESDASDIAAGLQSADSRVQNACLRLLCRWPHYPGVAVAPIRRCLQSSESQIRREAAKALGYYGAHANETVGDIHSNLLREGCLDLCEELVALAIIPAGRRRAHEILTNYISSSISGEPWTTSCVVPTPNFYPPDEPYINQASLWNVTRLLATIRDHDTQTQSLLQEWLGVSHWGFAHSDEDTLRAKVCLLQVPMGVGPGSAAEAIVSALSDAQANNLQIAQQASRLLAIWPQAWSVAQLEKLQEWAKLE